MNRVAVVFAVLLITGMISLRARAQDVPETDVTTSVVFHAACDCVVAEAEFYFSYTGPLDYDVYESTSLTDANGTVNDHESIDGYVDEYNEQADNVVWGDSYNFSADIDAECDPIAQPGGCEGTGGGRHIAGCCCSPQCGICGGGCGFANGGSGCSCEDGPPGGSPNDVESNSGTNIGDSCDAGPLADQLMNEYVNPGSVGIPGGAFVWIPSCLDFTEGPPAGYSTDAFSGGDITAWGIFQTPLVNGLNEINQYGPTGFKSFPGYVTGVAGPPIPDGAADNRPDTIYRTPLQNYTANISGYHHNEAHQFGLAIDFQNVGGNWNNLAAWAELATGSTPGASSTAGNVCIEPENLSGSGHVHADWRPEEYAAESMVKCPSSWFQNYIPTTW